MSGCRSDSECPSDEACLDGQCQDPCRVPYGPCGSNAQCETITHRPVCKCPVGWAGNPHIECFTCKFGRTFLSFATALNHMLFFPVDECTTNNDCPLDKACVSKECVDPCLTTSCGDRAVCEVDYHQSHCVCPPGLQGNPIVQCSAVECTRDQDCNTNEKCDFSTQECYDICQREPCGAADAVCEARNHKKSCFCPPPLQGDGNIYCGLKRKGCNFFMMNPNFISCYSI